MKKLLLCMMLGALCVPQVDAFDLKTFFGTKKNSAGTQHSDKSNFAWIIGGGIGFTALCATLFVGIRSFFFSSSTQSERTHGSHMPQNGNTPMPEEFAYEDDVKRELLDLNKKYDVNIALLHTWLFTGLPVLGGTGERVRSHVFSGDLVQDYCQRHALINKETNAIDQEVYHTTDLSKGMTYQQLVTLRSMQERYQDLYCAIDLYDRYKNLDDDHVRESLSPYKKDIERYIMPACKNFEFFWSQPKGEGQWYQDISEDSQVMNSKMSYLVIDWLEKHTSPLPVITQ